MVGVFPPTFMASLGIRRSSATDRLAVTVARVGLMASLSPQFSHSAPADASGLCVRGGCREPPLDRPPHHWDRSACDRLEQRCAELLPDGVLICAPENFDSEYRRSAIAADVGA
jgi:hypothetical protein